MFKQNKVIKADNSNAIALFCDGCGMPLSEAAAPVDCIKTAPDGTAVIPIASKNLQIVCCSACYRRALDLVHVRDAVELSILWRAGLTFMQNMTKLEDERIQREAELAQLAEEREQGRAKAGLMAPEISVIKENTQPS